MAYTHEQFKNCRFNPFEKDLLEKYPELKSVQPKCKNSENIMRYILFMYDPKSPLIRDIRNIKARKQEAAKLSGFDLEKDTEFLDTLYGFTDDKILKSTVRFLIEFIHDRVWSMIVSLEQTFYEYNERLLKPVESTDTKEKDMMSTIVLKSKLIQDLKEIHNLLKEYYKEIFEDDELREKIVNKITPESMARV